MIRELHSRLKSLDLDGLKEEAVWINRDAIIKANQSQLHLGETSVGTAITPLYRSRSYAEFKSLLSSYDAPNYTPDLYLTGDFYKSMQLEVGGGEWDIYSDDNKARDLQLKYKDIFGLDEDNLQKIRELVTKTFVTLLKQKLN